jgi:hypothetical protein
MAMDRLLKELNPTPGDRSGYIPQHGKSGTEEFERTEGSNGALHTKIVDVSGDPIDPREVTIIGNQMEYYGATAGDRPAANSVRVGAVYMSVDTQEVWQSNGTTWVVL